MTMSRFSLRTLIALVTLAALGCAALANSTEVIGSAVFGVTYVDAFGDPFLLIADCLFALVFAALGGVCAGWMYREA